MTPPRSRDSRAPEHQLQLVAPENVEHAVLPFVEIESGVT